MTGGNYDRLAVEEGQSGLLVVNYLFTKTLVLNHNATTGKVAPYKRVPNSCKNVFIIATGGEDG